MTDLKPLLAKAASREPLTREEAREIYRANYWNAMQCEELPKGVDLMVFHFGVNAGPSTAVRMLQGCVGTKPDGAVGQFTLRAVRASDTRALIETLGRKQLDQPRRRVEPAPDLLRAGRYVDQRQR